MDSIDERIRSPAQWKVIAAKLDGWDFEQFPRKITIEPDAGDPIQDTFSVFWIWMAQMSKHFSTKGEGDKNQSYTPQDMHDLMCNRFLGYTDRRLIGSTWVEPALITLTYPKRKTKERMCVLLSQIDEWAIDRGVFLITKRLSDYMRYKEAQGAQNE